MSPEDWQEGMRNEAASVEDVRWAREARRSARWASLRHFFLSVAATLLMFEVLALGMIGYGAAEQFGSVTPQGGLLYGLVTSLLALGAAYVLGRARFAPLGVVVAAAFFPVLTGLTGALLDVPTWPLIPPFSPKELLTLLARAAVAYFGACAGLQAIERVRHSRTGEL